MEYIFGSKSHLPGRGLPGPPFGARSGDRAGQQASGGWTFAHGVRPGSAQRNNGGPPSRGLTTCRRGKRGQEQIFWVAAKGRDLDGLIPDCRSISRELECHLSDWEGAFAGARGREVPSRYSWPHLDAQQGLWNQLHREALDSLPLWR